MAIRPPLEELNIKTHDKGFYKGFNRFVTVTSKIFVTLVVIWILSDIERSGAMLDAMKNWSYANLNGYYTYSIAFYILVCLTVILWPSFGRIKLGSDPNGKPEFSNFSWFSMIFGAGIGVVMCLSMISALSGVGRGVKWLSNINMVLSFLLLAFFLIFGATMFALEMLGKGIFSYVIHLPAMAVTVWDPNTELGAWQTSWSIFYWAWWIAFAPFVGLFLARISKNRTIREFGLIGIVAPSLTLFVWFSLIGGTGIDLELSGIANGKIFDSGLTAQLFEIIGFMLNPAMAGVLSSMVVVLLLTYLVTSADSALLVINTLNAAGEVQVENGSKHIIVWSIAVTAVVGALILAGGLDAITSAMIVAAIPFSFIIILMAISLLKALILDIARAREHKL